MSARYRHSVSELLQMSKLDTDLWMGYQLAALTFFFGHGMEHRFSLKVEHHPHDDCMCLEVKYSVNRDLWAVFRIKNLSGRDLDSRAYQTIRALLDRCDYWVRYGSNPPNLYSAPAQQCLP